MHGSSSHSGHRSWQAEAPGRLDVMGGIADYSGSLVLELPIRETARVRVERRTDGMLCAASREMADAGEVCVPLADCVSGGEVDYAFMRERLAAQPDADWAGYLLGGALVLMREKQANISGVQIYLESDVPVGKGVSSSAAIEIAALAAMAEAFDVSLEKTELPRLGQVVENQVVGAPCGLMDQLTCYLGHQDRLLPIRCQPDEVHEALPVPEGLSFVGIDSGVRHAVTGASYGEVRTAAFMGYSILARHLETPTELLSSARTTGSRQNLPFGGYLCNIPRPEFDGSLKERLPDSISGQDFLDTYGDIIDSETRVNTGIPYAVRACTRHPVYENHRVEEFMQCITALSEAGGDRDAMLKRLGELMVEAHQSYSDCGLGHEVTDAIVNQVQEAGPAKGVYGAKITGGGSGGTVCVLCCGEQGVRTAQDIARNLHAGTDHPATVFIGSSPGAWHRGVVCR